jgi:hypothetical protein
VEHTEPRLIPGERQAMEAWLDFHRNNCCIVRRPDRRPTQGAGGSPSRLSLLRLVRHMTEVERWWSRIHAANTGMPFPHDPDQTGQDFKALDHADAAANIKAFKQEIAHARAAAAGKQADDVVPSHGHHPSAPGTSAGSTCT